MSYIEKNYEEVLSILQEKTNDIYMSYFITKIDEIMSSKYHTIKIKDFRYLGLLFDCLDDDDLFKVMKVILAHINNPNITLQEGKNKGKSLLKTIFDNNQFKLLSLLISNTHGSMIDGYNEPLIVDSKIEKWIKTEPDLELENEESSSSFEQLDDLEENKSMNVVEYMQNLYRVPENNLIMEFDNDKLKIVCVGCLINDKLVKQLTEEQKLFCKNKGIEYPLQID